MKLRLLILTVIGALMVAHYFILNWSGGPVFVYTWGGFDHDEGLAVHTDSTGCVYVLGTFAGKVDLDPGGGVDMHSPPTGYSSGIFLIKFNADLIFQWADSWGMPCREPWSVSVDKGGDVYLTGGFIGKFDFDPGPGTVTERTTPGANAFLCKLNSDGEFR